MKRKSTPQKRKSSISKRKLNPSDRELIDLLKNLGYEPELIVSVKNDGYPGGLDGILTVELGVPEYQEWWNEYPILKFPFTGDPENRHYEKLVDIAILLGWKLRKDKLEEFKRLQNSKNFNDRLESSDYLYEARYWLEKTYSKYKIIKGIQALDIYKKLRKIWRE